MVCVRKNMSKRERQIIGFRILAYILSIIVTYFKKEYKLDTTKNTVYHLLDTREEKKGFLKEILIFIMEKLLLLLTDKETKKISNKKISLNTARKLYEKSKL